MLGIKRDTSLTNSRVLVFNFEKNESNSETSICLVLHFSVLGIKTSILLSYRKVSTSHYLCHKCDICVTNKDNYDIKESHLVSDKLHVTDFR